MLFRSKPADEVTLQEREKLRYFSLRTTNDFFYVDYSFDDPYGEKEINVQSLSLNPEDWNKDDLVEFPNLTKLELDYRWDDGTVFGKLENLKGLCCTGVTPEELKELVLPEQFVELGLEDPDSLEGISAFENLQILTIHDVESPDIRQLIPLKALKTLIIEEDEPSSSLVSSENSNPMTDYSPLSVMTGLERLSLKTSSIREFSFLKPLTALTDLSIEDSEAISLDPLAELTGLSVLYIADNASVQDYSPIGRLFGLKRLTIKKDSSPDDPDLSALSQLEELDIEGFNSLSGLRNLDSLKILSIHGCNANGIEGLSSLVNVECLTCYNLWAYGYAVENLHFIDGMAKLRYLDLCGIHNEEWGIFRRHLEVYGDISNVFNHPGLEELYLNGCTFGIDFDRLGENVSLKKLQMKEVSIKENFYVQSYGSVTDVWYDDVSFDEHTGFLTNYSNLEELYLDGNQLTNIQFVEGLANLTHLGINNNYVTELSPLNQAQRLEYLDIRQNPISGTIETGDGVEIVR